VRIVEKYQRLTPAHGGCFHGWIYHAMPRGNPLVIRSASHEIAKIYHETACHDGHVYPHTSLSTHLELTRFVLHFQDREAPIVAMGASPELPWLRRHPWGGQKWEFCTPDHVAILTPHARHVKRQWPVKDGSPFDGDWAY
jgi:hypothetical protein